MGNVVIWSIEVKCIAGKAKPPEENGIKLSNETFTVFTQSKIFVYARDEMHQKLQIATALQWCHKI